MNKPNSIVVAITRDWFIDELDKVQGNIKTYISLLLTDKERETIDKSKGLDKILEIRSITLGVINNL